MEWFKVYPAKLRSSEFIGSNPVERSTWMSVTCYCVEQENGGRIVGAVKWKDRQWQQACGVTLREVKQANKLISWDGDDVVVWNYPTENETEVKAKREGGKAGNKKRWSESHTDVAKGSHTDTTSEPKSDSVSESRSDKRRVDKKTIPPAPQGGFVGGEEVVEAIYQLYPRKVAKRQTALNAIRMALTKIDAVALRAAVVKYAKTPGLDREDGRFIPSPVTWFAEDGWKDYLPKPTVKVAPVPVPSRALGDVRLMFSRKLIMSPEEQALTRKFIEGLTPDDDKFLTDEERVRIKSMRQPA